MHPLITPPWKSSKLIAFLATCLLLGISLFTRSMPEISNTLALAIVVGLPALLGGQSYVDHGVRTELAKHAALEPTTAIRYVETRAP